MTDAALDRLLQEYVERLRRGEDATVAEYAAAHPELAAEIEEVFPVMAMMEGLKPSAEQVRVSSAATRADPAAPERIGPYAVEGELGRGGMGRVYDVRDGDGRRYALKLVHPHLLERSGFLARFLREFEMGQRIEHPGVVRTVESGVVDLGGKELPYLVLEYIEGETLQDLIDDTGAISERLAREIGAALAEALAAIHDAGIVHRDIKPANVVIAPDESIKLMDLGVALVHEEALRLTQTGEFVGSLLYAAPEQLRGRDIDGRADLYALGLVLYELIAGRHPETEAGGNVFTRRFGGSRAPRLRDAVPATTPFVEAVVATLLDPDPARRFASARELAAVLADGERGAWWEERQRIREDALRPRRFEDAAAFAGRDAELGRLDAAWGAARAGRAQLRVIRGEAGLGKSRLVSAWLDRLEAKEPETPVVWVEHSPGSSALGLSPIARSLRVLLGEERERRVRAFLEDRADHATDVLASLEHGTAAAARLDSASLETMYVLLLRGLAREKPIVLVVEDLHFASDAGRELFERLAYAFVKDPVFLLGTTRATEGRVPSDALRGLDHVDVIELEGLDNNAAYAVLRAGLGRVPEPVEAMRDLVRKSDGNPYCLLEFARALRSDLPAPDVAARELALPGSVRRLVEERLHALEGADRDLLGMAACSGYRFDPVVVCEAAGVPRLAGLRSLHRLDRERGLIAADGALYRFHHHLVQEALYDELPPALRAACHSALGSSREARLPADLAPSGAEAFAVGRHFLLGDDPARAVPYVVDGLDYLMALGESRRAAAMARRALEALADSGAPLRAHVLTVLGRALDGLSRPEEVVEVFEQALAAAREAGDLGVVSDVLVHLGAAVSHTGRHKESAAYADEALRIAEEVEDPVRTARALAPRASALYDLGQHEEAFASGHRALEIAREAGAAPQACYAAMYLAGTYVEAGRLADAGPLLEFALTTSHLLGDRATERFALSVLGKTSHMQGDVKGALELARKARRVGREEGNLRTVTLAESAIAHMTLNLGDGPAGLERLEKALETCARMRYYEVSVLLSVPRILILSVLGALRRAEEASDAVLDLLHKVPLPAIVARALPGPAHVYTWMGAFDEAEALIERGREMAREAGVPREAAMTEQAAAGLLDAQDRTHESAELYASVLDEVRARDMNLHVALIADRLAGLHARLGEKDVARSLFQEAHALAEAGPLPAVAASAGAWLGLLDDESPAHLRIRLERDAGVLSAAAHLRLRVELARRTGDAADAHAARAAAETLLAAAPEARRDAMRAIPLYADALA